MKIIALARTDGWAIVESGPRLFLVCPPYQPPGVDLSPESAAALVQTHGLEHRGAHDAIPTFRTFAELAAWLRGGISWAAGPSRSEQLERALECSSEEDLHRVVDAIEELLRRGARDEACRALARLQSLGSGTLGHTVRARVDQTLVDAHSLESQLADPDENEAIGFAADVEIWPLDPGLPSDRALIDELTSRIATDLVSADFAYQEGAHMFPDPRTVVHLQISADVGRVSAILEVLVAFGREVRRGARQVRVFIKTPHSRHEVPPEADRGGIQSVAEKVVSGSRRGAES